MNKILITICGRAGSKGFANKNLKVFLDNPLCYYTLASAFDFKDRCGATVDICLNTDSIPLKELILEKYPEVIPIERPIELSGDTVPKMAVFQQSLKYMEQKFKTHYDYLIDLDITSPLRQIDDVLGAYNLKLSHPESGLVFSGCSSRRNPYFNMVKKEGDFVTKAINNAEYTSRQQAPEIFDLNASIYVFQRDFLITNTSGILWETNCLLYKMEDTAVLDIDSEEDFELMQIVANYLFTKKKNFSAVKEKIRK